MTTFAQQFREHVTPRMAREIQRHGRMIWLGMEAYEDASLSVFEYAMLFGALHLDDFVVHDLRDWIHRKLSEAVSAAEADEETLAERERSSPVGYYEELAVASRNPEAMRWTFAAISPEYRAHLLAVKRGT